jgi:hypothetical protein
LSRILIISPFRQVQTRCSSKVTYRLTAADVQRSQEVHTAQTSGSAGYELVDLLPGTGELLSTTIDYAYDPLQRLTAADYESGPFFLTNTTPTATAQRR